MRRTQAVARLRHPNLARLLPLPGGAGLQPILGDAHKLSDFTLPAGTFKRFDLEQVVRLLLDVLAGLQALHEVVTDGEAFVHGEVCPSNVYVDEHGTARLVPLLNVHSAPLLPRPSGYAAPERLLGSAPDARVDTFSVGVMLWEALAGARLFPDPTLAAVLARKVPPIQLGPRVAWARPLCAIAERAVSFEPKARFQTAHELASAIAQAAAQQLSGVDHTAWQEEAPTPVFQPRLHLASLRASAPPPAAEVMAVRAEAAPDTVSPIMSVPDEEPPVASVALRRGARAALAVAGLLAAVAAAWVWQQAPSAGYRRPVAQQELSRVGAAAPAPLPALLPTAAASSSLAAAPPPSAPPAASVAPASSPSVPVRASKPNRAAHPKPALPRADYGI